MFNDAKLRRRTEALVTVFGKSVVIIGVENEGDRLVKEGFRSENGGS